MNPLLNALGQPESLRGFSATDWDRALRMARRHKLLAHLGELIRRHHLENCTPQAARNAIASASVYAKHVHTLAQWEVSDLLRRCAPLNVPLVLLKGMAYIAAGLPAATGRYLSDVDILVQRDRLEELETQLLRCGWSSQPLNDYDQRYYRAWAHEIPPLRHRERGIELDVHHNLFPLTGRLRPDPERLWAAVRPLPSPGLFVLAPEDMFLHSATHLLAGEVAGGFRDLVDMQELIGYYANREGFWQRLPQRAGELGLERPLYYALYCLRRLLHCPIPDTAFAAAAAPFRHAPSAILTARLAARALTPTLPGAAEAPLSAWLLYVRSHWIKMPAPLLAAHLSRKAWRRLRGNGPHNVNGG